jgi:large subunit ribosomal protein L21
MSDQEPTAAVETEEPTPTVEPDESTPIVKTPAAKPKGYAIIETGGKQYRVSVGDRISVERLPADAGGEITIDRVLLLGGDGATRIGMPVVDGASVTASVDDHFRGEKIIVFKYKAKKRYRRRIGHRQELTHLTITGIAG